MTLVLPLAFIIDWWFGEPDALYRRVPHPIVVMGRIAGWMESRLNQGAARLAKGALAWLVFVGGAGVLGLVLEAIFAEMWLFGLLAAGLVASAFVAYKSLGKHVAAVSDALAVDLESGRVAVGHIVGRDTSDLDSSAVARAAIESLAENFSDGVVAPLFWLSVAGLPGLIAYKAINTLDSMWGYRNPRYELFGKPAAVLDDLANWIPARLSGLIIIIASGLSGRAHAGQAFAAMRRDARKHDSPNAGWPEAAMAGALGILIAGPRVYQGVLRHADYIGHDNGRSDLSTTDIQDGLRLYRICGFVVLALCFAAALIKGAIFGHLFFV